MIASTQRNLLQIVRHFESVINMATGESLGSALTHIQCTLYLCAEHQEDSKGLIGRGSPRVKTIIAQATFS
jgi:hypothetical protein